MSNHRLTRFVPLVAVLCFGLCSTASAARLLTATIVVDGKPTLETAFEDDGNPFSERVWRRLDSETPWTEIVAFPPSAPRKATLLGHIVVRIQHGKGSPPIVEAKASKLELTRPSAGGKQWYVKEGEVARLAQENSIPTPSPFALSEGERARAITYGILVVSAAIAATTLLLKLRSRTRSRVPRTDGHVTNA